MKATLDSDAFKLLVESVLDYAIFLLDRSGHILTWNRGAERIKGYREDEIVGRHFSIFYTPEDIAASKPALELELAKKNGRIEDEGWRLRKDGTRFWANVVITALVNEKGQLYGFGKLTRDLTERRATEEGVRKLAEERAARSAAEQSAARLRLLAEASRIFADPKLDVQGTYDAIARQCADVMGDGCSIALAVSEAELEVVSFQHRQPEAVELARRTFFGGRVDFRTSLVGPVIRTGEPRILVIDDPRQMLSKAAPAARPYLERFPTHGLLSVPLRVRGRLIGALTMMRHRADPPYTEDDLALLSDLADRASFAIQNARLFESEVAQRRAAEQAAEHMTRLQSTTAALARALTPAAVGDAVLGEGLGNFDARAGLVYLLDGAAQRLDLIASLHASDERRSRFETIPMATELPVTTAVRTAEPVFIENREELIARHPMLRGVDMGETQATMTLPLVTGGRGRGAIVLTFAAPRTFDAEDRAFAMAVAQQCAQAMERALLAERDRETAARNALLAEASEIFAQSLDPDATLQRLAEITVPRMGDWCSIEAVDENGGTHAAAVAHVNPEKVRWAKALREKFPPDVDAPRGVYHVIRTGQAELYPEITVELVREGARSEDQLQILEQLGLRSAMCVPVVTHDRTMGAITLCWAETPKRYGEAELQFMLDLAHRAAIAIENGRLYRQLQAAVQVRDDFVAVAGHELKTPLAALMMQLQTVDRMMSRDGDLAKARDRISKLMRSAERLDTLINQMLDVSRITSSRLRIDPEPLDLADLVRDVVERFTETATRARCRLEARIATHVTGVWDRLRLEQVVTNLLTNAIKYGAGKPIEIELRSEGVEAILEVVDHGIGIDLEQQKRIFERFERAVSSRDFGGFGLGLWITRQIVEASGGRIAVQSEPGSGARFQVRLPRQAERALSVQ